MEAPILLPDNKKAPQPMRGEVAEQLYEEANTEMYLSYLYTTNVFCEVYSIY
jgi:hypothetical protein